MISGLIQVLVSLSCLLRMESYHAEIGGICEGFGLNKGRSTSHLLGFGIPLLP